ncbi:uncharacterized protein C1orf131 [Zeugodacus cucurbitae]|uniref:uncharacterized protein C1orf131 n=1 Tax=Zeugodacus cucurbitae TaxID=28588 RepID=UPI0005968219|nr:uncharacterized protein C1orf131 [Zeugodacus cucurbitae]
MNVVTDFKPVPTRAALALQRKNQSNDFQAMVFEDPAKSLNSAGEEAQDSKKSGKGDSKRSNTKDEGEEFDIRKARNEVLNFAMNNQRVTKNKKKMETFQLIKMGMKAPKKPYKNYKDLLDERKRLKNIREERKKFHQLGKTQTGAASVKCRSKTKLEKQQKKRAPVTAIDQNYGVVKPKLKKRK